MKGLTDEHTPLRVAIVADLLEERWPSMDLVADMLATHLRRSRPAQDLDVEMLRPSLARASDNGGSRGIRTLDRFVNRFWDYPRWLRARASSFDIFHIVDHSYAHLVHVLPAGKTVVTCHDTDAFLSLVQPTLTTSTLPKALTRRLLTGMQKAAAVTCVSQSTYDELRTYDLIPLDRLTVVHNGVHPGFLCEPSPAANVALDGMIGGERDRFVDLLHVGTCIPRKRIDLLLRIVAAVRDLEPRARLLKAGGRFTNSQRDLIRTLGLESHIVELPFLEPDQLAALYRRAQLVVLPAEREGFGLPVVEALARGTAVVATDLAVFREVGGSAVRYCPLGDIAAWRDAILARLATAADRLAEEKQRRDRVAQAGKFTWERHAESMIRIYRTISAASRSEAEAVEAIA
jgi:glycosyltransferase involved in cell wall biosynthesis